jgi:hypothetical protein
LRPTVARLADGRHVEVKGSVEVSVVVPVFNEAENLAELYDRLVKTLDGLAPGAFELIFVDDGSTDGSFARLRELASGDARVRAVKFVRNFGQHAALSAGMERSRGDVVVFMDADLQNAPEDLPRFVAKIREGYDLVSGWRVARQQRGVARWLGSWIVNRVMTATTGVFLHDHGCGYKAITRRVAREASLPALLVAAAFATYPPATAVFAICPTLVYTSVRCIQRRHQRAAMIWSCIRLFALAALLNFPGIFRAGKFLLHMMDLKWVTQFGDIVDHISWTELYGFSHHRLSEQMGVFASATPLSWLLAIAALLFTLYGAWRMRGIERTAFLSLSIVYVPFLIWLRYVLDYPYGFFKALVFATFPALVGLAIGFQRFISMERAGLRSQRMLFVLALATIFLTVNFTNLLALSAWVVEITPHLPSLSGLRAINSLIRTEESIHIRDAKGTPLLWMTYFLRDYNLALTHYSPYYMRRDWPFYQETISADLVLVDKDSRLYAPWADGTVYENARYALLRKHSSILSHLDFQVGGQSLKPGGAMKVEVLIDRLTVAGRSFSLGRQVQGGELLRVGVWVPAGARVRFGAADRAQSTLFTQDAYALDWRIQSPPATIVLTNEGERPIWIQGWLEIVVPGWESDHHRLRSAFVERHREPVLPGSAFFGLGGWYPLEEGVRRWIREAAFALFRNPFKAACIELEGVVPGWAQGIASPQARVLLNGQTLGELDTPGAFRQKYCVSEEVLGSSEWGELEITASRTFNPKRLGLSEDSRDLGVMLTHLQLLDPEIAADGLIDIGTSEGRKHLGSGWSYDEQAEHFTFVWADAPESVLWVAFPQPSDFEVQMRLSPFGYPSAPPQQLSVYVNGTHLRDITLANGGWQTYAFTLPRSFLAAGINAFQFVYRNAVAPAAVLPGSQDPRTLAVAFDFIRFQPVQHRESGAW